MSTHAQVSSAMRSLIRAQRLVFQGDARARLAARELNRTLLASASNPSSTPEDRSASIQSALQVAQYLRENVLQGVPSRKDESSFALRILPSTVLGDNDSIKKAKPAPSLAEIESTMNSGGCGGAGGADTAASATADGETKPVRRRRRGRPSPSREDGAAEAGLSPAIPPIVTP